LPLSSRSWLTIVVYHQQAACLQSVNTYSQLEFIKQNWFCYTRYKAVPLPTSLKL
jgi:hypothetical protein